MMKKNLLVLFVSVIMSLGLFAVGIRLYAPHLWPGFENEFLPTETAYIPVEEQQFIEKNALGFFDHILKNVILETEETWVDDPIVKIRGMSLTKGMFGGFPIVRDMLGFRNQHVPNTADIVCMGDSQTHSLGTDSENTWPLMLGRFLTPEDAEVPLEVYGITFGGWSIVQYDHLIELALAFEPKVIVVATYTGNDFLEAFDLVIRVERFESLRSTIEELAPWNGISLSKEKWNVSFDDFTMAFTPKKRLVVNNRDNSRIEAGVRIVRTCIDRMYKRTEEAGVRIAFTTIPTKELVYANRMEQEGIDVPPEYETLIEKEAAIITDLRNQVQSLPNAIYVDVVKPMQDAAVTPLGIKMYKHNHDGHPTVHGYRIIAQTVTEALKPLFFD